jgi:methyl-accepting chemotaxis protein
VTVAVALHGQAQMGDRFDEVRERARHESLARELKFGVADVNGWQTAYGYDSGASRPEFERSVAAFRTDLRAADQLLTDPTERRLLSELHEGFDRFMNIDAVAYRALRNGNEEAVKRLFLGPEIQNFETITAASERLARYENRRAADTERAFDDARDDARKRLIAVALGAAIMIVLLLLTAWDVARLALESAKDREPSRVR